MRAPPLSASQYLMLAGVLALTTVGGYFAYVRFAPRPAAAARVTAVEVGPGNIVSSVTATGSVATPAQSKLAPKASGRLTQLQVNVGDQVQEGQPLAKLDDADLQAALQQAQASYNSALAKLQQTQAGSRPEDVAAAQAQVDSARVKLQQTQAAGAGGPDVAAAQAQLDQAKAKLAQTQNPRPEDITSAQAQLDQAKAKLDSVTNPRPEDITSAQSQVASAQSKLDQLQHPRPEDIKNAEAGLVSARAKLQALLNPRPEDVAAAQAQLDQAKTKLAQLNDVQNTAAVQDIANAELAVKKAQVAYDKALADAGANTSPAVGSAAAPRGTSAATSAAATQADNTASVAQALIDLQTAQNNLGKLQAQSPTAWDVRQAQESVQQAQANLDKVKSPSPQDIQQAQAAVDQAQTALDKLKNPSPYDVQQAQEAVDQAQASLDKVQNPAPSDVQAAQQAVVQAQAGLDKVKSPSPYDVQQAQEAVNQAQASLDKLLVANRYDLQTAQAALNQAQANLDKLRAGNTDLDVAIAQAAVDQAQAALDQAKANLDGANLTAPYGGVVAATGANVGEQVGTGTALVTLVDTRQVRVDVVVDETDVAKVQPGQPATITMDALPGQRIPGTVSVIAPTGTVTQGVVNYTVQIQVDPAQAQGVRPGMTATAAITTASKDNALVVPNRAIRTQGRAKTVDVLDADGKTSTRPVQTGLANDQVTEVLSGLQPGDRVVIPTTTTAAARPPGGFGGPGGPGGGPVFVRGG